MPPLKVVHKKGRKTLVLLLIIVGAALLYFNEDRIASTYHSIVDKFTLPHYNESQKISHAEFTSVISEPKIIEERQIKNVPGLVAYLERVDFFKKTMTLPDFFSMRLIEDTGAGQFYLQHTLDFKLDRLQMAAFPKDFSEEPIYMRSGQTKNSLPYDSRWKPTGGFACFSCGCSCYIEKDLQVSNSEFYVNVIGKDFAIRRDRQGIYHFDRTENSWTKLTPKVDPTFKIGGQGCEIYYTLDGQAYKLSVCKVA